MGFFLALMVAGGAAVSAPSAADLARDDLVDAPVLTRMVEKGETLGAADFTAAPLPPTAARGALSPDRASGQEALRRLQAGRVVRAADIGPPRIIRRGQAITIVLRNGPLTIQAAGRALTDAAVGEPVRVVNLSSSRTLDAVADASGRARIPTP